MLLCPGRASFEPSSVLEATVNLMAASSLLQKAWLVMFFWAWVPQAISSACKLQGRECCFLCVGWKQWADWLQSWPRRLQVAGSTVDRRVCICLLTLSFFTDKWHMMLSLLGLNFWLRHYFCYEQSPLTPAVMEPHVEGTARLCV